MNKKVGIVGFGVVGKGMASIFKNKEVRAYDINMDGVTKEQINECDLAVVCVPTPDVDGHCEIRYVEEVVSWIKTPLILIKSTVSPGTTERLKEKYGKRICFSPEYMGESKYYTPMWKYPHPEHPRSHDFMIIGGDEKDTIDVWSFFKDEMSVDTHVGFCSATEAELTKYMENTFFATKVTFCNEFFDICKAFGVEYDKVRELWLKDSRVNPMHTAVFKDNRGYGGKCYPKDTKAIVAASKKAGFTPTLLEQVIENNDNTRRRTR